jgi:alpha-1,6-mannosyltransferase
MNVSSRWSWAWACLGLAGSALVAYAAPRAVADRVVGWWYMPAAPSSRGAALVLVYAGMAALCCAWLLIGRALPSRRRLLVIGAAWALPLALAPPLFSRDVYSYLAQGTILHLGHSPYHSAPVLLGRLGHQHVLDAVSPFWRSTTAPYGPLFLGAISLVAGVVGSHLIAGVLLIRLVEMIGLVLLAIFVPRVARSLGTDGPRALWLALLSPLVTLELVGAGHNDVLMVGMLVAGVAGALDGRPLLGIAMCALAATVKVPALAGAVFIAVAWARAEPDRADRWRFGLTAGLVVAGVLGAVTLVTGVGLDWLSTSVFSTPAKVHLAITPATAIGYTASWLLSHIGLAVSQRGLEDTLGTVAFAFTGLAGLMLLYRVRISKLVPLLGAFLLIAAAGGPAAWPWYFVWGLALVASVGGAQRSLWPAVAIAVSVFVVKPSGILALPLGSAPAVVVVYAAIAAVAWHRRHRGHGGDRAGLGGRDGASPPPSVRESASSALA